MKAFSDLEQSKKLEEFLPLETADMYWDYGYDGKKYEYYLMVMDDQFDDVCIPAWSLAALLELIWENGCTSVSIPKLYQNKPEGGWYILAEGLHYETSTCNCIIDAAFEMVCWLKAEKYI